MTWLAVVFPIPTRLASSGRSVEIAFCYYNLIAHGCGHGDDFPGWRHNNALADQFAAVFDAGFGDADNPGPVLVSTGLEGKVIVKILFLMKLKISKNISFQKLKLFIGETQN